jgi:hypothetical protein
MMRWVPLVVALLVSVIAPSLANAGDKNAKLATRRADLAKRRSWVAMTVGYRDIVNAPIRKKLLSGLPTTITTRAYVFREKTTSPTALSAKTCRVVFDLWDEVFRIELSRGGKRRKTVAVNVGGVLRRCAEAHVMPIVRSKLLEPQKRYFIAVLVEVNPLSKKMLKKIKRWVSRPRGAGAVGPGDSLFGSFVGLFITKVPEADRTLRFRTQTFIPAGLPKLPDKKKKRKKGDERASR